MNAQSVTDLSGWPIIRLDQIPSLDSATLARAEVDVAELIRETHSVENQNSSMSYYLQRQLNEIKLERARRAASDRIQALLSGAEDALSQTKHYTVLKSELKSPAISQIKTEVQISSRGNNKMNEIGGNHDSLLPVITKTSTERSVTVDSDDRRTLQNSISRPVSDTSDISAMRPSSFHAISSEKNCEYLVGSKSADSNSGRGGRKKGKKLGKVKDIAELENSSLKSLSERRTPFWLKSDSDSAEYDSNLTDRKNSNEENKSKDVSLSLKLTSRSTASETDGSSSARSSNSASKPKPVTDKALDVINKNFGKSFVIGGGEKKIRFITKKHV